MLSFCLAFFVFAIIYLVRITVFIVEPSSKGNILAGKIIRAFTNIGLRATFTVFLITVQIPNVIVLYAILQETTTQTLSKAIIFLYGFTIIISFVGTIIIAYNVIFHLTRKIKRWDYVALVSFASPWVLLIILGIFLDFGIKVV